MRIGRSTRYLDHESNWAIWLISELVNYCLSSRTLSMKVDPHVHYEIIIVIKHEFVFHKSIDGRAQPSRLLCHANFTSSIDWKKEENIHIIYCNTGISTWPPTRPYPTTKPLAHPRTLTHPLTHPNTHFPSRRLRTHSDTHLIIQKHWVPTLVSWNSGQAVGKTQESTREEVTTSKTRSPSLWAQICQPNSRLRCASLENHSDKIQRSRTRWCPAFSCGVAPGKFEDYKMKTVRQQN